MSTSEVKKRIFVGGLPENVTEDELKKRFELFLTVSSVNLKSQTDSEGNHMKTFAHLNVEGSEAGLKKCYNAYQNAKWKGCVMKLEDAKESFLDRLAVERLEGKNKSDELVQVKSKKNTIEQWKPPEIDKLGVAPVPGTPIPGKKDWVVGKYGRVLPVLNVKKSHVTKAIKHDPSKFCHASKVFKDDALNDTKMSKVNCDTLTWEIDEPDSEMTKKRKGEFPPDLNPKKVKSFPAKLLNSPAKETFPNTLSPKKENLLNTHLLNESVDNDQDVFVERKSDSMNINEAANDDGLEIVKVGGSTQNKSKPTVRTRFDSDYESDGGNSGTETCQINNIIHSSVNKSSKNKNSISNSCGISIKNSSSTKKNQQISDDSEDEKGGKEITGFKGISSLITKSADTSSNKKSLKRGRTSSPLNERTVNKDSGVSDDEEEKSSDKVYSNSKKKEKRKSQIISPSEKPSTKRAKKSGVEKVEAPVPNPVSTAQKDSSQYSDLYLSEFVAKAPKNSNPSRNRHDPYDSDLDSNNFELVARKLAKKAGFETVKENNRKRKMNDLNTSTNINDEAFDKILIGREGGVKISTDITRLMRSMAGGYSAGNNLKIIAEASDLSNDKQWTENTNQKQSRDQQVPQSKDSMKSASTIVDKRSSKRKMFESDDEFEEENSNRVKGKSMDISTKSPSRDKKDKTVPKSKKLRIDATVDDDDDDCSDIKRISKRTSKPVSSKDKKEKHALNEKTFDSDIDDEDSSIRNVKMKQEVTSPTPSKSKKTTTSKHKISDKSGHEDIGEIDAENEFVEEEQEISLAEEKKRNIQVLEKVVGKNKVDKLTARLKRDNVQIMDMNQLRFDPTKFKSPQNLKKESQTKKKAVATPDKAVKKEEVSITETPKETPSKDKTHTQDKKQLRESTENSTVMSEVTMSDSLMSMLKTETQPGFCAKEGDAESFSFLDMFDGQMTKNDNDKEATEKDSQPAVKPLSGLMFTSTPKDNRVTSTPKDNRVMSKVKGSKEGDSEFVYNNEIKAMNSKHTDGEVRNSKHKESKDKVLVKNAVALKDESKERNIKEFERSLEKSLKDAGRVDIRFTQEEWKKRNSEIRQNILKICRSRSDYAVRKKWIEEEREKGKAVRKFGSWKKK